MSVHTHKAFMSDLPTIHTSERDRKLSFGGASLGVLLESKDFRCPSAKGTSDRTHTSSEPGPISTSDEN